MWKNFSFSSKIFNKNKSNFLQSSANMPHLIESNLELRLSPFDRKWSLSFFPFLEMWTKTSKANELSSSNRVIRRSKNLRAKHDNSREGFSLCMAKKWCSASAIPTMAISLIQYVLVKRKMKEIAIDVSSWQSANLLEERFGFQLFFIFYYLKQNKNKSELQNCVHVFADPFKIIFLVCLCLQILTRGFEDCTTYVLQVLFLSVSCVFTVFFCKLFVSTILIAVPLSSTSLSPSYS